jgi:phage-related protein
MNQVEFDGTLSYDDWGVYLTSFFVGDAEPKENYVDIPFGHGSMDLTEALTGEVSYGDREFEAVFTIKSPRSAWPDLTRAMRSYLNGKKRKIRIAEEPDYYLIGRCRTSFEIDGVLGSFTVSATCEPWKYKNAPTTQNVTLGASGTATVYLSNSRKRVIPTITTSAEASIVFNGQTTVVTAGTHKFTNIVLVEAENQLTITGTAGTTVSFEYQEGAL